MNAHARAEYLRQAVRDRVTAADNGITQTELAADLSACYKAIGRHLFALRQDGSIGYVSGVSRPFWVRAELHATIVATIEAERRNSWRKRRTEQERRRVEKKRAGLKPVRASHEQQVARVAEMLNSHPKGLRSEQVAVIDGCGLPTAKKRLRDAMRGGLCLMARIGETVRWFPVGSRDLIVELRAQHREERRQQACSSKRAAWKVKHHDTSDFERESVHRWVSAATAAPLRPTGPASVWGLAA